MGDPEHPRPVPVEEPAGPAAQPEPIRVGSNGSRPLAPAEDALAAAIVAGAEGHPPELVAELRGDPAALLFGMERDGRLAAVFALRREGLTMSLPLLAAASAWDEWRALKDAVELAGRWPVVVETTEEAARTYQQAGFRMVSRRKELDGTYRYRLGWHVPTRRHPR